MKRVLAAFSSLLFLSFFLLDSVRAQQSNSAAQIDIVQPVFDFGTVAQGEKVTHEFIIRNVGGDDLLLQKIVASCGCTATSSSEQKIAPGSSGGVTVVFDTDGFSGEKVKTVRLFTNDPRQVSHLLTLKGKIEPEVSVEPKRIYLGEIVQGQSITRKVTVSVREETGMKLGDFKSRGKGVIVEEIESSPTRKVYRVSIDPEVEVGELRDRVVVSVFGGKQKTINIPIYAAVERPIRLVPRALSFGVIEGSQPIIKTVRLENETDQPLEIKELSIDHPAIEVSHKVLQIGKRFEIQVSLDPSKVNSDVRTSLDVLTNAEEAERLSLSVYGVLPPKL